MHKPTYVLYLEHPSLEFAFAPLDGLTVAQFYATHPDYKEVSEHYSLAEAEEALEAQRRSVVGSVGIPRV